MKARQIQLPLKHIPRPGPSEAVVASPANDATGSLTKKRSRWCRLPRVTKTKDRLAPCRKSGNVDQLGERQPRTGQPVSGPYDPGVGRTSPPGPKLTMSLWCRGEHALIPDTEPSKSYEMTPSSL
ncbi:uncharacterized protein LOC123510809 isoform X2 [Portunus trituberculatus]|uniref:uncharacterized protein LOC123510809 isoform X2 n=1 Tax=Portunus trituberculatus TaxID=210409 RepID=UPI001E1D01F6|nr:uncharacterized protein LOC123510809 isoform X2 [Portunus trituberculatus]